LPCNFDLTVISENEKNKNISAKIVKVIETIVKSNTYEYIVIDTNPSYNQLIRNLFLLSNVCVVPAILD